MILSLYNWTMRLGESRYALYALAVIAFIESSVFPIPPDVLIIPMIIALPRRAFLIAFIATLFSVLGGMFGYYIGAVLFDSLGQPLLAFYGKAEQFEQFSATYNEYGAWAVLVAGITPFPFKVITILRLYGVRFRRVCAQFSAGTGRALFYHRRAVVEIWCSD